MQSKLIKGLVISSVTIGVALLATAVLADGGDITSMATSITTQAKSVATLLNVASYVAGVGFALAGILQFKAHKENPQSTPLSKPVVMIVVAACLLFLPTIMNIAGSSLFGSSGQQAIQYQGGGQ